MTTDDQREATLACCQDCDLLQQVPPLARGDRARCSRCGNLLALRPAHSPDLPLALAITATIVYLLAQAEPLMRLSALGRHSSTTIIGGTVAMWQNGEPITAVIVFFCIVVAPALYLGLVIAAQLAARAPRAPQWAGSALRWGLRMQPWAMYEVMLLGVLVSLIKIAELASVDPGIGLYALGGLVILFAAIAATLDAQGIWQRVAWAHDAESAR